MYTRFSEALHPVQGTWQVKALAMSVMMELHQNNREFDKARYAAKEGLDALAKLNWQDMDSDQQDFYLRIVDVFKAQ